MSRWMPLGGLWLLAGCVTVEEADRPDPPGPQAGDGGGEQHPGPDGGGAQDTGGDRGDGGGDGDGGVADGGVGDGGVTDGGAGDGGAGDGGDGDGGVGDGGAGDGGAGDGGVECGFNAEPDGRDGCECLPRFDWCDAREVDCCAWDATVFRITFWSAGVLPYDAWGEPWDWDGDIPDWLVDAIEIIGWYSAKAATMAEVLGYVDMYAPELLEGVVPPDPYMDLTLGPEWLGATDTEDDTYEPYFAVWIEVDMTRFDLFLGFFDEDLVLDDDVQDVWVTLDDAQYLAGRGEYEARLVGNLYSLTLEIEPVW